MKRSDLAPMRLLRAVEEHGIGAFAVLVETFPAKVVYAAIARDTRSGFLTWGVSPTFPFLTERGRAWLAEADPPLQEPAPDRLVAADDVPLRQVVDLVPTTGVWCDGCESHARYTVDVYATTTDGVEHVATLEGCTTCRTGLSRAEPATGATR